MPTLPTNPDDALNDTALDAIINARVNSNAWVDDAELRSAIHWEIIKYYGLDTKYGFNSSADALNSSKWHVFSIFGSTEGSNDLDRFTRIWQQYLARYAHDAPPQIPFTVLDTQTPMSAGIDAGTKIIVKQVEDVGNVFMWLNQNFTTILVVIAVIYVLIQAAKTETGTYIIRKKLEKAANV